MTTVTVEQVQATLPELIARLADGDAVVITAAGGPVARLVPPDPPKGVPDIGRGKGKLISYADDDEHLSHFRGSMPGNA